MIDLPHEAIEMIRRHAHESYPEECCGALVGTGDSSAVRVTRADPIPNDRTEERGRRFRISPEEYRRVERRADEDGLALVGFYHSHPDHPAVPSSYDRDHALPFFHYVVLSVVRGQPREISSWILSDDRGEFQREILVAPGAGR